MSAKKEGMERSLSLVAYEPESDDEGETVGDPSIKMATEDQETGTPPLVAYGDDEGEQSKTVEQINGTIFIGIEYKGRNEFMEVSGNGDDYFKSNVNREREEPDSSFQHPEIVDLTGNEVLIDTPCGQVAQKPKMDFSNWGPPPPTGPPDPALIEKIKEYHEFKRSGRSINRNLRKLKSFQNPDILGKLVKHCNIQQYGSNYPPELFNPYGYKDTDFYEQIGKSQEQLAINRQEAQSKRTRVEFVSGSNQSTSEDITKKRKGKSKWDVRESEPTVAVSTVDNNFSNRKRPAQNIKESEKTKRKKE